MSDYEVIFGLDCVGGDQAPIDCAVVKTSDGKPGIMLDGEVFTKESLTPEPAGETKIPGFCDTTLQDIATITVNDTVYTTTPELPIQYVGGNGIIFSPGDEITITNIDAALATATVLHTDGTTEEVTSYTVTENDSFVLFYFEPN